MPSWYSALSNYSSQESNQLNFIDEIQPEYNFVRSIHNFTEYSINVLMKIFIQISLISALCWIQITKLISYHCQTLSSSSAFTHEIFNSLKKESVKGDKDERIFFDDQAPSSVV